MSRLVRVKTALLLGSTLAVALAAALVGGATRDGSRAPADAAAGAPAQPLDASSLVVRARAAGDLDGIAARAVASGYTVSQVDRDLQALELLPPEGRSLLRGVTDFIGLPGVLYAEPAARVSTADMPADPLYSRQSGYLTKVNAPQAWDIEKGQASVIVAVLDTGVDISHPDLQGRIWQNSAETPNNNVDDDGNGCIDDVNGCAFVKVGSGGCMGSVNGFIRDEVGHGTFVSGIIAANGDGAGMVGVARGVTIMPVKVLDCIGSGNAFEVAQGILYAARNGARVINLSLGGNQDAAILREAARRAQDEYGALVVAASGNTGKPGVAYPARYPEVLAVGAASAADADKRATFSTTGPEVDVVAIGEGIIGTVPRTSCRVFLPCIGADPYAIGSGTSFSAPQVAGLAALILSRQPGLAPAALRELVKTTATAVPPGDRADWAGSGRINMLEALRPQFRLGVPGVTRN